MYLSLRLEAAPYLCIIIVSDVISSNYRTSFAGEIGVMFLRTVMAEPHHAERHKEKRNDGGKHTSIIYRKLTNGSQKIVEQLLANEIP